MGTSYTNPNNSSSASASASASATPSAPAYNGAGAVSGSMGFAGLAAVAAYILA